MEKARWNLDFSLQSPCSLPTYCLLAYPHSASLVCLFHRALELGNISLNKVREFCMKTCPLPCRYISLRYFQIFASPVYPSFESSIILNSSIYNFYGKSENRWFFFFFLIKLYTGTGSSQWKDFIFGGLDWGVVGRNCFLQCQMNELQEMIAQPAAPCLPVSQQCSCPQSQCSHHS